MNSDRINDSVSSPPWVFHSKQLAHVLRAFRQRNSKTREDVQKRLKELLEQYKTDQKWVSFRELVLRDNKCDVTLLESLRRADKIIEVPSIKPLAEAYDVPPLIFDPLLSEPVEDICVVHRPIVDFIHVNRPGLSDYGYETKYWIPKRKLFGTEDVAIIYLEFKDKRAHSTIHHHPGDELLYVEEEGTIELRLENMGLRCRLEEGDLIHYDAGQEHSACNIGKKPAKVFLVRFYQLFKSGTRRDFFDTLVAKKPSEKTILRVIREMKQSEWTKETQEKLKNPNKIFDQFGFGRFLQLLCSEKFQRKNQQKGQRLTLDELVKKAKAQYNQCDKSIQQAMSQHNRSRLNRIHHGEVEVLKRELPYLAKIYGIEVMLFYDYLFPAFRDAIVVCKNTDMRKIVGEGFRLPPGVSYKVPCRRLAHSDMTIALIELKSGAATIENRHPGSELLKPLQGEIKVEFGPTRHAIIRKGECGHFHSHINHVLRNTGKEKARVLVIRFLGF